MEDKKVKAGSVAVGICLFVIAILLVVIVFVFYNSTIIKNNLQSEVNELKTSLEEKDKKVEELDKDSELVKELYNIILKYDNYNMGVLEGTSLESLENIKFSFYRNGKIKYNDLTDIEKVICFLNSIKDEDYIEKVDIENINLNLYQNEYKVYNVNYEQTKTADKYSNVNENIKRIFGRNAKIQKENYGLLSGIVEYYDDSYYIYMIEGGGLGNTKYAYSEIQKVEQNEEEIYIYDKYIYLDFTNALVAYDDELVHVYTSADKTKEIGKEKDNFKFNQETREYDLKDVFEKYEDKLNTYKHTFKKAEDGTYYWVSSEIYE